MTTQLTRPNANLTPNMAVAIFKRQYPGVPEVEIIKAGMICARYGLFPYSGQVFIIPFKQGGDTKYVTVIGIKALREIAENTGHHYSYLDGPRVMNEQEEIEIYGARDPALIRAIVKIKNNQGEVYPGYGIWRKSDSAYGTEKGNTPHNMAFIRAERNAVDRMAPGTLPDAEMIDAEFVEKPVAKIVEQGNKELTAQAEKDIQDYWPPKVEVNDIPIDGKIAETLKPPEKPARDPSAIKTINELKVALYKDFGLRESEQLAELNIKQWSDLAKSLQDAYRTVAATR